MILRRVEEFIAANRDDDEAFNRLALDVFACQVERVPLYRRLCELRGVEPARVSHWSGIPAAPADLFKEDSLWRGIDSAGAAPAAAFVSSGTTQGEHRSRHELDRESLALYRNSSLAHFASMVMPDDPGSMSTLLLGPSAVTHPASSLGAMYSFVVDAWSVRDDTGDGDFAQAFDAEGRLDLEAAIEWLRAAAAQTRPVLLLTLRSTITAIFEAMRARKLELRLPADSRIVHTGGSKGGRTLSRNGILKAAWRFLHIPAYLCVEEYGMTELLSQFYDDALRSRWNGALSPRAKVAPPWVRTTVVDPATLAPVPPGERGILRHLDLANCASIAAVQTLDIGVCVGRGFDVMGRASGAETRGCSQLLSALV
jgi:hypothetical protein